MIRIKRLPAVPNYNIIEEINRMTVYIMNIDFVKSEHGCLCQVI